ncbi:MAG TPA: hypothetical protein VIC85_21815 [Ktedonobacterales bacterium]
MSWAHPVACWGVACWGVACWGKASGFSAALECEAIASDKKSLAYALAYQAPDRTLTDAEVDAAHRGIVEALARAFGATLRA